MSFIDGGSNLNAIIRRHWNWLIPGPSAAPVTASNFVAIKKTGGVTGKYSADAVTWTEFSFPALFVPLCIAWTGSNFVVLPASGIGTYRSADGVTWAAGGNLPNSGVWTHIVWNGAQLLAAGFDSGFNPCIARSLDEGVTWTNAGMVFPPQQIYPCWDSVNSRYIGTSGNNPLIYQSTDNGLTWAGVANGMNDSGTVLGDPVVFAGKYYIGANGVTGAPDDPFTICVESSDLVNWVSSLTDSADAIQAFAQNDTGTILVAPSAFRDRINTFTGGTWTKVAIPAQPFNMGSAITFKNDVFVAVSQQGNAYKSADGLIWTPSNAPVTTGNWTAVA